MMGQPFCCPYPSIHSATICIVNMQHIDILYWWRQADPLSYPFAQQLQLTGHPVQHQILKWWVKCHTWLLSTASVFISCGHWSTPPTHTPTRHTIGWWLLPWWLLIRIRGDLEYGLGILKPISPIVCLQNQYVTFWNIPCLDKILQVLKFCIHSIVL